MNAEVFADRIVEAEESGMDWRLIVKISREARAVLGREQRIRLGEILSKYHAERERDDFERRYRAGMIVEEGSHQDTLEKPPNNTSFVRKFERN